MVAGVHLHCISVMPRTPCSFQNPVCRKKKKKRAKVASGLEEPALSPDTHTASLGPAQLRPFLFYMSDRTDRTFSISPKKKKKRDKAFLPETGSWFHCFCNSCFAGVLSELKSLPSSGVENEKSRRRQRGGFAAV